MSRPDRLQRMLFESANVRGVHVQLAGVLAEIHARHDYPEVIYRVLDELVVAAAVLSSGIKFSGRLSLQIRGPGPVRLLMADCTREGGLRAVARFDSGNLPEPGAGLTALFGDGGVLTLNLEPQTRGGRPWQGMVDLSGGSVTAALEHYFRQSEQLATRVLIAGSGERAAGLMIQRLPGEPDDPDGWPRLEHLVATVSAGELAATDAPDLLRRLFHAEDRRLFKARGLTFHCPCNRQRVINMLRGMGRAELESLLAEQDPIQVQCQFCNQPYRFDALDVTQLLADEVAPAPDGRRSVH